MRIGCFRAREALKKRTLLLDHPSRPGFRKDPGLFVFSAGRQPVRAFRWNAPTRIGASDCSLTSCREHACTTGCGARSHQADIAQQAERDHAMVEAPGSMPGIRSTSHCGCASAQRPSMRPWKRGDGRNVRCRDAGGVQRERFKRGTALALEHNRNEIHARVAQRKSSRLVSGRSRVRGVAVGTSNQKPSSSSRFEGGNRPHRLGGAGTRHRMEFFWGCSSTIGRAAALQAAGCRFEPCHLHHASLTQWPECRPV